MVQTMKTFKDFITEIRKYHTKYNPEKSQVTFKQHGKSKLTRGLPSSTSSSSDDVLNKRGNVSLTKSHNKIIHPDADIEKKIISKELERKIEKVLKKLSPREELVIRYYFGIGKKGREVHKKNLGKRPTFQDIGFELAVSATRVTQIFQKALRKLSHPKIGGILKQFT